MELTATVSLFSALAQPTRLRCVELLLRKGHCTAGELASSLGVPANTMSSHLTILSHAGLIRSVKEGRHVIYRPDSASLRRLLGELERLLELEAAED